MQPEYLLSLELNNPPSDGKGPRKPELIRLKASYSTMKSILTSLQSAANEMKSIHCQRLQKYLS